MKWLETFISIIRFRIRDRREFAVARATYRLANQVMVDRGNGLQWDEKDDFSKVLIVFLVKNLHSLKSVRLLCARGLAKDAIPLLRVMFEELVDLKYMAQDKKRVQDFIDYDTYQRFKLGKGLERMTAKNIDRPRVAKRNKELSDKWEKIKHRFTYKTKDGKERDYPRWTRDNVRTLSNAVGLGEEYEYLYANLSNYIHSSPMNADEYVLGKKGDDVVLVVGASPSFVPEILATASGIYLDMLRVADEDRKMNLDSRIKPIEEMLNKAAAARAKMREEKSKINT